MSGKQAHSCAVNLSWGSLLWKAAPSRPEKNGNTISSGKRSQVNVGSY